MRDFLPILLLMTALLAVGCDSDDPSDSDAVFRVEVTDAQGDAVEGLRVGVRPCVVESCDPGDVFSAPPGASSESSRGNTTRPVALDFFEAEAEGRDVDVTWRTTSETNNQGFEVQMRAGEDQPFTQVGFVESKAAGGTTDDPQDYALRVPHLDPGTYTFQLVQVDVDGATTTYDDQRDDATVELQEEFLLEGPYPNPFEVRTALRIAAQDEQHVTVEVQDLAGAPVQTLFDETLENGIQNLSYEPEANTPDGLYHVVVEGETFADTVFASVVRIDDSVPQRLGATDADGAFATDERAPFPGLFDLPPLERRNTQNEVLGTFQTGGVVEIILTDPATGEQQTYERPLRPGENAFSLTWDS